MIEAEMPLRGPAVRSEPDEAPEVKALESKAWPAEGGRPQKSE